MKIIPLTTEKSLADAKDGCYTFIVDKDLTKAQIRKAIEQAFEVHVVTIRTARIKAGKKKNLKGQIQKKKAAKKAWVTLAQKEKINLFETETK